ncbi:hypothetical protein [Zunongwangia atlantica]|uniref:Uncharacterized protein n=1 Tax=Zunongwangia atlantica 22II14-10F7 TaxID=1185767 RepID=A0A1Y1SY83_9FLAO|nr:hypothetical protein [Zunongwangia atlantica]MAC64470.1 hypothetical protein [Flavobacteriaceae bacterium]ORL43710.1 hypothetical protein IIF7_19469 [Zunongwangia atlantica 22II14-10F7]|tara:strand:- start:1095 stop:1673 length:579 start_codon:yes stop_codon:yes gene_type:complete
MIRNINRIVVIIFLSKFFIACQENDINTFKLSDRMIKTVENNKECLEIFKNNFGVDYIETKKYHYVEALTRRFIEKNKEDKYQSFVLIKLNENGEIPNSTTLTIGKLPNGKGVITKYVFTNNGLKGVSKVFSDFNFDELYKKLGNQASKTSIHNTNVLLIDFKSNENCSCKFYNLSLSKGERIKNFSFFDFD